MSAQSINSSLSQIHQIVLETYEAQSVDNGVKQTTKFMSAKLKKIYALFQIFHIENSKAKGQIGQFHMRRLTGSLSCMNS